MSPPRWFWFVLAACLVVFTLATAWNAYDEARKRPTPPRVEQDFSN